ncbi:MAG: DUF2802 domain-containing protein [Chromatiales bacterium]|nr:DUF2802 domain-containing protein [Chromatiales bacterium]
MTIALAIALVLLAAVFAVMARHWRKRIRSLENGNLALNRRLAHLEQALSGLTNGSMNMGGRVVRMETHLRELRDGQDRLTQVSDATQPYGPAIRMVQGGASVEDLITNCNLTRSEAELIHRMHASDREDRAVNGD